SAKIKFLKDHLINKYFSSISEDFAFLDIGEFLYSHGASRVKLNASGFDRHTFLCGQSGSGKTYALGILIEQILLNTELRIVIIDPNSDFIKLDRYRSMEELNNKRKTKLKIDEYNSKKSNYENISSRLKIFRPRNFVEPGFLNLQILFSDLEHLDQESILQLDTLKDVLEINRFRHFNEVLENRGKYSFFEVVQQMEHTSKSAKLIENLKILDWDIWCPQNEQSIFDIMNDDWRCLVFDIGTLTHPQNSIITKAILDYFWKKRESKNPVLIVIDEAHNICPQITDSMFVESTKLQTIQIAGEGRKYGLYLLLASQRPEKVHANVVSQCDNLFLMRMNSEKDLKYIKEVFTQIPSPLLDQSTLFEKGEALVAGKIVGGVTFTSFEGRQSMEGGNDVPPTWATKKQPN
ncbi:MAG: ATP-binding protein, partial [Anaerolineae bacterium]|nr:ATP-binding protein [Anaerolineae bacterium]